MAATPSEGLAEPSPPVPAAPTGTPESQRQARYNHLVGRLRSRQITMEEATELFALMQAMLRASEAVARRAAMAGPGSGVASPSVARSPTRPGPTSSAPDDMFLVGLLAMGAGAGLLAAMARRLADAAPAQGATERPSTGRRDP